MKQSFTWKHHRSEYDQPVYISVCANSKPESKEKVEDIIHRSGITEHESKLELVSEYPNREGNSNASNHQSH